MLDLEPRNCFRGSLYQIEKNNSKIVSLEKIENLSILRGFSREYREYREVTLITGSVGRCQRHHSLASNHRRKIGHNRRTNDDADAEGGFLRSRAVELLLHPLQGDLTGCRDFERGKG